MGAAGKDLHGHGKRHSFNSPSAAVSDGGYGLPPHPVRIRPGQKFWSRSSPGRRRLPIVVGAIHRGNVDARRTDRLRERVTVSLPRLSATRPDGQGEHYQFIAWTPRRYRTWAVVVDVDGDRLILVLPEWHPARPVRFPTRLLPAGCRHGAWLAVKADLSATSAARLNLDGLAACEDPGRSRCPLPVWLAAR
jgi:hypothetical protein